MTSMGQPSPGLHLSFQHCIQICGRSPAERIPHVPWLITIDTNPCRKVLQCSWLYHLYHRQLYHGTINDHRGIRRSPHFCWCHPYQTLPWLPGLNFGSSREKPKESFRCRPSSSKLGGKNMKSFTSWPSFSFLKLGSVFLGGSFWKLW